MKIDSKYHNKLVIYRFVNKINGKSYIGKTNNIQRRVRRHINDSKYKSIYFHRSLNKYGISNFSIEILCICDNIDELNEMEYHYIKQYKSRQYQNGYNLTDGGEGSYGYITSEETRKKLSKSLKNRIFTKEWKDRISKSKKRNYIKENHPNFGKKLSKTTREKISKSAIGRTVSEETKRKISDWSRSEDNINRNTYIIKTPSGDIVETKFLSDYCKENNLTYSCMTKVCRGERKHHKGYTITKK